MDFNITTAPTACPASIRLILALAAAHNWEIHQVNFKNAYLNGDLDEQRGEQVLRQLRVVQREVAVSYHTQRSQSARDGTTARARGTYRA